MSENDLKLGKLFQQRKNELYLFLYSFICLFYIPTAISPSSSAPIPSVTYPSFPPQSTPLSIQKGSGLPWGSTKNGISSCSKTKQLPFY